MNEKQRETQVAVKGNVVEEVGKQIEVLQKEGKLALPANFAAQNALMSAWLILQETVDRNKVPVLQSCSRPSIVNSLLDMVIQGLNPSKKQCYFIAYGNKLTCMRSYFGSMAIIKNLAGAKDVHGEIIYAGDEFVYKIRKGNKKVISHTQKFANIGPEKIAGAYCTIAFEDGREFTDVMDIEQIKKAWKKSKIDTDREGSTHKEFPEEMARRTVINRACKRYINSSSDDGALLEAFNRTDEISTEEEVAGEIKEKANQEVIDIEKVKVPGKEEKQKEQDEEKLKRKESKQTEEKRESSPSSRSPGF
jgi:recombination protein RecT